MTQRTRIKFCGLVRPEDVQTASRLGVDALGLVFYPRSSRLLDLEQAAALRRTFPSWITAVGLFVDADPAQVRQYSGRIGLDVVQFHGNESAAACAASVLPDQRWWRAVRMRSPDDLLTSTVSYKGAEAFLLDAYTQGFGGSGEGFDWSWVPPQHNWPLIVSGGLDSTNVARAIECLQPMAVDVSSGIQSTPREKDPERMEAFVAAVMAADALVLKRKA